MCGTGYDGLVASRFWLIGIVGFIFAVFGVVANGLLAALFLSRSNFRHSPFFFLGFVALFDTLLDSSFILLMSVPVTAEYFSLYRVFIVWIEYIPSLYLFSQIFKISSVFCLIVASVERYCMTKHWTFSGFQSSTRWAVLCTVTIVSITLKCLTSRLQINEFEECTGFNRYQVSLGTNSAYMMGLVNSIVIFVPFFTLIFLNGGIVMMLRKQNVQQLRSLITELTMGHDVMKIRRRNLRRATNTLLVIISAYLISNLLGLILTLTEYFDADFLHVYHPDFYRLASDGASLLTVVGNAIRCPAHFLSNNEIRQQFAIMILGEVDEKELHMTVGSSGRRPSAVVAESPWISLLLSVHEKDQPQAPLLTSTRLAAKRHSAIAIC